MNQPSELRARDRQLLRKRLIGLMLGRLVVSTTLLSLTYSSGDINNLTSFTPQFLLALAALTFAASLAFAVTLPRAGRALERAAFLQLGYDILLSSALMYVSGGIASAFTFLFGTTVLMAALIVGPTATRVTSLSALCAFFVVGVPLAQGWLPSPPDQPLDRYLLPVEQLAFPLLANVIALLLVALLANTLSGRLHQTRGALEQATESAASLERLNLNIVQSLASGLLTTDLEGRVSTINPAGAAMFERQPDDLAGHHLSELLPAPPDFGWGRGEGEAGLAGGRRFPAGFTVNPLLGSKQETIGKLVTFQDLTEIERLRATAERAERLATLGRLATGLAHEIRNPLSSIRGSVELVRESSTLRGEDEKLLTIVLTEVQRLDSLVSTMLDAGTPRRPQLAPTDLRKAAQEVTQVAKTSQESLGVAAVVCELEAVVVPADPDQVRQVIWNLLKNAIQVSPEGGTVTVATRDEADHGVVEVRDEGPGIPKEDQARLFETFYSTRPHGVGIGLALVNQIVGSHEGTVEVESTPGEGAAFRVRFPKGPFGSAPVTPQAALS